MSNGMGLSRKQALPSIQADAGSPLVSGKNPQRRDPDKQRRRRQIGFRLLLAAVFLAVAGFVPLLWSSVTYIQTLPAAAAVVGAIIAIQKADASADAAARAEAAQETAERASRAAHHGLAFQARPNVDVFWARPAEGHLGWDLHLTADRVAKDIEGEWHFADGRPPIKVGFPDVIPDPETRSTVPSRSWWFGWVSRPRWNLRKSTSTSLGEPLNILMLLVWPDGEEHGVTCLLTPRILRHPSTLLRILRMNRHWSNF